MGASWVACYIHLHVCIHVHPCLPPSRRGICPVPAGGFGLYPGGFAWVLGVCGLGCCLFFLIGVVGPCNHGVWCLPHRVPLSCAHTRAVRSATMDAPGALLASALLLSASHLLTVFRSPITLTHWHCFCKACTNVWPGVASMRMRIVRISFCSVLCSRCSCFFVHIHT